MPTFPRNIRAVPRLITPPRFPEGLADWGQSGKGQFRAIQNQGRAWRETYGNLSLAYASVRQLIAAINQGLRERTVWDVQHLYYQTLLGAGGGSPTVNGSGQIGSTLDVAGAHPGTSGWLLPGDIIQVTGGAVVYDVTDVVNVDGSGLASIPISPPIYSGGSPDDGAAVEIDPTAIYFKAVITDVSDLPDIDVSQIVAAGMTVSFREQPA